MMSCDICSVILNNINGLNLKQLGHIFKKDVYSPIQFTCTKLAQ